MTSILEDGATPGKTTSNHVKSTRHAWISDTLKAEIAQGTYPLGSLLPSEAELCKRFQVSRHTVREGLRSLVELGLVARHRGAGTRVIATSGRPAYVHTIQSLFDILQYMRDTRIDIGTIELRALTQVEAEFVPAPEQSRWLKITGVRRSQESGEVMSDTVVFVHSRFAPILHDLKAHSGPIFPLIEERTGETVAQVRQIISGATMPESASKTLQVPLGSPAIRIIRRFVDASGGPMLTSINWHPLDRFTYAITLSRE